MSDNKETYKTLHQWVVSLAITIVGCAMFFLAFANTFLDVQRQLVSAQTKIDMLQAQLNSVENNLIVRLRLLEGPPKAAAPSPAAATPAPAAPSQPAPIATPAAPSTPPAAAPAAPEPGIALPGTP